jgi:hypothetical protein
VGTLYYISSAVEEGLKESVDMNIDRYVGKGFTDLATGEGWSIPLSVTSDLAALGELKPGEGSDVEVFNSLVVWKALSRLTPALANEGRLWTRLAHVECFQFSRDRWMKKLKGPEAVKSARAHFFGDTMTRRRDDNSIGRLWWNAYIARQAMHANHHDGLKALLRRADIRSNIVERARTGRMPRLAGGLLRAVLQKTALAASEEGFRTFMKNVNRLGGGVLFELMEPTEIDQWLERCLPPVRDEQARIRG